MVGLQSEGSPLPFPYLQGLQREFFCAKEKKSKKESLSVRCSKASTSIVKNRRPKSDNTKSLRKSSVPVTWVEQMYISFLKKGTLL